jgi:hypothetical protein
MRFPVTVWFDDNTKVKCENMKDLKNEILNAHSEQTFANSIHDADGKDCGCHWSVKIEII